MADTPDPNKPNAPSSDSHEPIPLEPADPHQSEPSSTPGKAEIDSPGLLDDFEPGADFDTDPELERVVKGIPVDEAGEPLSPPTGKVVADADSATPAGEPISSQASWRLPAAIGAFVTLTAAVFAGIYADNTIWAFVLITIYWAILHTATGVGALVITAVLLGRPIGHFEGAAARMFLVVSLFLVVFRLDIPIPLHFEETILAAAAYFGGLVFAFRLAPRDAAVVAGAHFGLVLLVGVGSLLSSVIQAGAVVGAVG